jgi:hypothetical protein
MNNVTLPSQVCSHNYQHGENRQTLCDVVDKRICTNRPISIEQFTSIGHGGGQTIEIREPDLGEMALSFEEVQIAVQYGISA